ncbi:MAG: DUF1573 domain-containing protein [Bacteroidales bacterium]|nr:DUF1573 domain-containing protein [Bacteroidales bacterium]HOY39500.1 DUF1573 domain-containing protein [Bacteroidales bacterium]
MKKIYLMGILLMGFIAVYAQGAVQTTTIKWEQTENNFGTFKEDAGPQSFTFNFTNTGKVPLVLTDVKASCGCTTPQWSKEPVQPGKSGFVTATYNPSGRPGSFSKSITVTANTDPASTVLKISGEVIPMAPPQENK